eukprot:m.51960 g.51960  ORF g.51960 m.51960 type:complete len:134 (+) comp7591_c0_seq1:116-517(+)
MRSHTRIHALLPARFIVIVVQVAFMLAIFKRKEQHVTSHLPFINPDLETNFFLCDVYAGLVIASNCLEFILFFLGYSMFAEDINLCSIAFHLGGDLFLCYFYVEEKFYDSLLFLFLFSSLPPLLWSLFSAVTK